MGLHLLQIYTSNIFLIGPPNHQYLLVEVVVAPTSIYLDFTAQQVKNGIQVAAQNAWSETKGAFTGEIR